MIASKLIEMLEYSLQRYGDLEVLYCAVFEDELSPIKGVVIELGEGDDSNAIFLTDEPIMPVLRLVK